jgi:hypothetical protein
MFMCCVVFSYYVFCAFLFVLIFVCLLLLNECVSSPMLGSIIIFVYLHCAMSVIGHVTVDPAHK